MRNAIEAGVLFESALAHYEEPMPTELLERWVEALRSGKYGQVRERLRYEDSYCCLGVLCDVIEPQGWEEEDSDELAYRFVPRAMFGEDPEWVDVELPNQYRAMTRLDEDMLVLLMKANDGVFEFDTRSGSDFIVGRIPQVTFDEIASLLEQLQAVALCEVTTDEAKAAFIQSVVAEEE